jgi:NAD(P)-dependent dehydrogenase (short-subunit alcohol dehydrogenase family)
MARSDDGLMSAPWIDLTGRVAVVTGAAAGIGRAAARALADAGATLIAIDRDASGVQATTMAIGGTAEARALDVTDAEAWSELADWIRSRFGRLDILVNSAGVSLSDRVGDADLEIYRRTFAINVEGSLLGMAVALSFMRPAGKGTIINLSSAASLKGNPIMASYGASKAAVAHYTRSAALEVARAGHDIRINAVHPGLIDTSMAQDLYTILAKVGPPETVMKMVTTGRPGRAEEVADLILYLASDRASFISGASIVADRAQSA